MKKLYVIQYLLLISFAGPTKDWRNRFLHPEMDNINPNLILLIEYSPMIYVYTGFNFTPAILDLYQPDNWYFASVVSECSSHCPRLTVLISPPRASSQYRAVERIKRIILPYCSHCSRSSSPPSVTASLPCSSLGHPPFDTRCALACYFGNKSV